MDVISELEKPIEFIYKGSEKEYEKNVYDHLEEICDGLGLPKIVTAVRQKQIRFQGSQVIMDIVVRHIDESATIFEVKKINNKNPHTFTNEQTKAIGQMLLYKNIFEAKTNAKTRVILVAEKIHPRTMIVFCNNDLPVTLLEFQKDKVFVPYKRI